jgi:hypothetical protein
MARIRISLFLQSLNEYTSVPVSLKYPLSGTWGRKKKKTNQKTKTGHCLESSSSWSRSGAGRRGIYKLGRLFQLDESLVAELKLQNEGAWRDRLQAAERGGWAAAKSTLLNLNP